MNHSLGTCCWLSSNGGREGGGRRRCSEQQAAYKVHPPVSLEVLLPAVDLCAALALRALPLVLCHAPAPPPPPSRTTRATSVQA